MADTIFSSGSVITPGFGSYADHESFGRIEITGDFTHLDATTFIDFNVFGNTFYKTTDPYGTAGAYGKLNAADPDKYTNPYLDYDGDDSMVTNPKGLIGSDTIAVTGDVRLAGTIELRPQSGYYAENIDIHFLQSKVRPLGGYENVIVDRPARWFSEPNLDYRADGVHLVFARNLTPFRDAANTINTRSVARVLDAIYNDQKSEDWLYVLDWLWLMDDAAFVKAMGSLSGETRATSFYMPIRAPWKFAFDRINWTTGGDNAIYFGQQNKSQVQTSTNALWANAFYDSLNLVADGNVNDA
jgi:hypothetical protein